jgi:transcriptional regulator with XRE-family HTH domain
MTSAYESGNVPPILVRHRLRIAREYAGLEQDELAERIGVSRNTIINAEKGHREPRRITFNAWALATGVPVSWLMGKALPWEDSNLQPFGYQTDTEAMAFAEWRLSCFDEAA